MAPKAMKVMKAMPRMKTMKEKRAKAKAKSGSKSSTAVVPFLKRPAAWMETDGSFSFCSVVENE
jgi:hypothetical protein